jgi:hypothetical protein
MGQDIGPRVSNSEIKSGYNALARTLIMDLPVSRNVRKYFLVVEANYFMLFFMPTQANYYNYLKHTGLLSGFDFSNASIAYLKLC